MERRWRTKHHQCVPPRSGPTRGKGWIPSSWDLQQNHHHKPQVSHLENSKYQRNEGQTHCEFDVQQCQSLSNGWGLTCSHPMPQVHLSATNPRKRFHPGLELSFLFWRLISTKTIFSGGKSWVMLCWYMQTAQSGYSKTETTKFYIPNFPGEIGDSNISDNPHPISSHLEFLSKPQAYIVHPHILLLRSSLWSF